MKKSFLLFPIFSLFFFLFILITSAHATIFGIKTCAGDPICPGNPSFPPSQLFSFQEDGSSFQDIGVVKLNNQSVDVDGLALSSRYGLMGFVLTGSNSQLVKINSNTAQATVVGSPLSSRKIRGAAFDSNGVLWAVDEQSDELLRINPQNGNIQGTPVKLQYSIGTGTDIAIKQGGSFFISAGNNIYSLDINSGTMNLLFTDTHREPAPVGWSEHPFYPGLAFPSDSSSFNLFAYEVNGYDDIYYFDQNFSRHLLYSDIISSFNAGRGDLASSTVPIPGTLWLFSSSLAGLIIKRTWYKKNGTPG